VFQTTQEGHCNVRIEHFEIILVASLDTVKGIRLFLITMNAGYGVQTDFDCIIHSFYHPTKKRTRENARIKRGKM
jgi:hypothetical protein